MFSRDRKRFSRESKNQTTSSQLTNVGHEYSKMVNAVDMLAQPQIDEDFPSLPISPNGTPCKEPANKKAHVVQRGDKNDMENIIKTFSNLINARFDTVNARIDVGFETVEKNGQRKHSENRRSQEIN